jgi:hypothetical protein
MGDIQLPRDAESRRRFWQAEPYPHVALDGFFRDDFFSALSNSMRQVADRSKPTWSSETEIERKKVCFSVESFDDNLRRATELLSAGPFLAYLEGLLEVKGLIPLTAMKNLTSRSYFHVSSGGAFLGSHVDQSYVANRYLDKLPFARRFFHVCSVVFYGSPRWDSSYGGHTILFDATGQNAVTTVECKPNRVNIFLHTSTSFHGVSEMATGEKRYSMYMDYYLPQNRLQDLKDSIVRNGAKCEPKYWLHGVTFIPNSVQPLYHRIYEKYLRASSRPV